MSNIPLSYYPFNLELECHGKSTEEGRQKTKFNAKVKKVPNNIMI